MFPIKHTLFLCTVTLVKNTVRLIGNIQKWPFTADFLTHVQRVWNCSFTIIQTNRIFFSIFRIELNLRGDNGVIRVLPKTWNRWFQTIQKARLNSVQLRGNIFHCDSMYKSVHLKTFDRRLLLFFRQILLVYYTELNIFYKIKRRNDWWFRLPKILLESLLFHKT